MPRILQTLACALLMLPAMARAQFLVTPLLVEGEAVPSDPGEQYENPTRLSLNNHGQAFVITAGGSPETIWGRANRDADFERLLAEGDPAPGIAGANIEWFATQSQVLADTGVLAISASLAGAGIDASNDSVVYAIDIGTGDITILARSGQAAPGTGRSFLSLDQRPQANDDDSTIFAAYLTGLPLITGTHSLYAVSSPGAVPEAITVIGDQAPGLAAGAEFSTIFGGSLVDGNVSYLAVLSGGGIDSSNDRGLWYGSPTRGAQTLLAREGDPVPGMAAGTVFSGMNLPTTLADGQVAMEAVVSQSGEDSTVLLRVNPSAMAATVLIRDGDAVPDIAGATIQSLNGVEVSRSGTFFAYARLEGSGIDSSNDVAVFIGDNSGFRTVAREGTELRVGAVVDSYLMASDSGQFAFTTRDDAYEYRLHASMPDGEVRDVLSVGDIVEVNGTPRTVAHIDRLGFATRGAFEAMANDGDIVFIAEFDDGTSGVLGARISDILFADGFEDDTP